MSTWTLSILPTAHLCLHLLCPSAPIRRGLESELLPPCYSRLKRAPFPFQGPFSADPIPPFSRATRSPSSDALLDMNGPPPPLFPASNKHLMNFPVALTMPRGGRFDPLLNSAPHPENGPNSAARQQSGEQRAWDQEGGKPSQGAEMGWWGVPRLTPQSEGLRMEAAVREWYNNGGRAGTQGDPPAGAPPQGEGEQNRPGPNAPPQIARHWRTLLGRWSGSPAGSRAPQIGQGGGSLGGRVTPLEARMRSGEGMLRRWELETLLVSLAGNQLPGE